MISNREYLALNSLERPEATMPMSHDEFMEFCSRFEPDYTGQSSFAAYRHARELLSQACYRIAELQGRLKVHEREIVEATP